QEFSSKYKQFQRFVNNQYNQISQNKTVQMLIGKQNPQQPQKKENQVKNDDITNFQHASYFAASFLFIMSIISLNSFQNSRKSVLFAIGGMITAISATFYQESWNLADSFRWLSSFLIGGSIGLYFGLNTKITQYGQAVCFLQSLIGLASFLLGIAQFERLKQFKAKFNKLDSFQTVFVCLLGTMIFSSAVTCYFKLDKKNIAKEPLNLIGKYRNSVNFIVLICIGVFGLLYVVFSMGFALWMIFILALYIGWGLVVSVQQRQLNVIIPFQTVLMGITLSFVGFVFNRDYLIIVGALCITGGYKLTQRASHGINCGIFDAYFKSWNDQNIEIKSNISSDFAYNNQDINFMDLSNELMSASNIVFVPGNGIYQQQCTKYIADIALYLQEAGKNIQFCIHPSSGKLPGHMNAILAEYDVAFEIIKELEEVDFSKFELCIIVGAYDEINPDFYNFQKIPTCQVWESNRVVYIQTKVENNKNNGVFDYNNVFVLKGDNQKNLEAVYNQLQLKGVQIIREICLENEIINKNQVYCQINEEELFSLKNKCQKVLGVLNEFENNIENRVSITPELIQCFIKNGINVWIEKNAGKQCGYTDEMYCQFGAKITNSDDIYQNAHIIVLISQLKENQIQKLQQNLEILIAPLGHDKLNLINTLVKYENLTVLDINEIPEDDFLYQKLSVKQNNSLILAHRGVLEGFYHLNKSSRGINNKIGQTQQAQCLVIGADSLGLNVGKIIKQTFGANVSVFDQRDGLKESIKKMGFLPVDIVYENQFLNPISAQKNALQKCLQITDLIIITKEKKEEEGNILNEEMCSNLKRGAVIVDLVVEKGGNCSFTQFNKVTYDQNIGITVIGYNINICAQRI
ncbi:nad beta subunit, putative, partial [Ichthyophthirius multifiliis]